MYSITSVYSSLALTGKTIILDPGHGGVDPGTINNDIYEKNINLEIALKLHDELIKLGANVILTRDGDYDLSSPNITWRKKSDFDNRIKLINESDADLFISIHQNHINDVKYSGAQVFYSNDNTLASIIQENFNKNFNGTREVKTIPDSTYMYSKLEVDGVLIECGFMSNYTELNNLQDNEYQIKLSKNIANSIAKYLQ